MCSLCNSARSFSFRWGAFPIKRILHKHINDCVHVIHPIFPILARCNHMGGEGTCGCWIVNCTCSSSLLFECWLVSIPHPFIQQQVYSYMLLACCSIIRWDWDSADGWSTICVLSSSLVPPEMIITAGILKSLYWMLRSFAGVFLIFIVFAAHTFFFLYMSNPSLLP